MSKSRKRILWVGCVVACSLLAVWIYFGTIQARHNRELFDSVNISKALEYYAELHDGNLPNSWDDLRRTNIITPLGANSKGAYISKEAIKTSSDQLIENIKVYQISFGLRPDEITISNLEVLNADGEPVLIIKPRTKTYLRKYYYRDCSRGIARAMKRGMQNSSKD